MINVRTADMVITPVVSESSNGRKYYSTDVMEPVSYNVEFSLEGGQNPKHLEALYEKCANEGTDVEIKFSQKKGRFGQVFVIYDVKPVKQSQTSSKP